MLTAKEFGVGGMCFAGLGTTTLDRAHKTSSICACDPVAASDGCNVWSKILPYSGPDRLYGEDPRLENNAAAAPPVSKPASGGSATNPAKPASPNNPTSPGDPAEPTNENANGGGTAVAADVASADNGAVGVVSEHDLQLAPDSRPRQTGYERIMWYFVKGLPAIQENHVSFVPLQRDLHPFVAPLN
ncbi:hypothetical protein RvY_02961 [Ramazzottius varieornatus]|uniref:Uncharacterized protein n=1 Tax=Ramazzottius varieornatus TaxID=947166 RepID=A0A1D1UPW7_RAMVA|nr:hypothetical protein RvY_02961 [Ramazzottius varieornatus]